VHTEYLLRCEEPVVVEPSHGMVIMRGNRIARYLMAIHEDVRVEPMYIPRYLASIRAAPEVEEAILLRHHYGEDNYGHFFLDIVPKLLLAERFPALENLPFIISRALAEKSYFQNLLRCSSLAKRRWIVQDGSAIRVKKLYCLKGIALTRDWIQGIGRLFGLTPPPRGGGRRVFLKRAVARRRLVNQSEVENYLSDHGFETVDAAALSHPEQIALFHSVRYLVGEHGSGVMNILFRQGAPLSVLELFPPTYLSPVNFACCELLGAAYARVRGLSQAGPSESYRIPIQALQSVLPAWLDS
jgi:capsular polysaccharide biosynthesis protein